MSSADSGVKDQSAKVVLRGRAWVAPLCWIAVLLDGFDAVVLGALLPSMTADSALNMSDGQGTWVTTIGLVGMMIGALFMGQLTDKFGRRKLLIFAVIAFSILTCLIGFAQDPFTVGALRFLAGLGLGGCLPTSISMVTEFAGVGKSSNATTLVMTGYHVGALLTAVLAIWATHAMADGWRLLFILAGVPMLILVPLMMMYLPESPEYLASKGRVADAKAVAEHYGVALEAETVAAQDSGTEVSEQTDQEKDEQKTGMALLLSDTYRRNSVLIWVASFMGLLLVYGLNNYLPSIMSRSGYGLGDSLGFLVVLNTGAIVGLVVAGRVGDRYTPRVAAIIWFTGSAVFLAALAIRMPVPAVYVMVFLTGCFVFSAQNLMYAFTAANHPPKVRGTALGMSAGIGRAGAISGPLVGGSLLSAGMAYPWAFFTFAAVGAFGAISSVALKTMHRPEAAHEPLVTEQAESEQK